MNTTQNQPHQISNTQWSENKTTDVVIHKHSRRLLKMAILMSETCRARKKWNKIASDIRLAFHSSTLSLVCFEFWTQVSVLVVSDICYSRDIPWGIGLLGYNFLWVTTRFFFNFVQLPMGCFSYELKRQPGARISRTLLLPYKNTVVERVTYLFNALISHWKTCVLVKTIAPLQLIYIKQMTTETLQLVFLLLLVARLTFEPTSSQVQWQNRHNFSR